jgi:hypothetical protein
MRNIKRVYSSAGDGGVAREDLGSAMRRTSPAMQIVNPLKLSLSLFALLCIDQWYIPQPAIRGRT